MPDTELTEAEFLAKEVERLKKQLAETERQRLTAVHLGDTKAELANQRLADWEHLLAQNGKLRSRLQDQTKSLENLRATAIGAVGHVRKVRLEMRKICRYTAVEECDKAIAELMKSLEETPHV